MDFLYVNSKFRTVALFVMLTYNIQRGADKSLAPPGRNKLQRPNSGFIQHTPHEAQYTS